MEEEILCTFSWCNSILAHHTSWVMITDLVMQCVNLFNTSINLHNTQENFKSEYQRIFYNFVVQIISISLHLTHHLPTMQIK